MLSEAQQFQIHTIGNESEFKEFVSYFNDINPEVVVVDVETDSEVEKTANLYGIGICFRDNEAFYIPWKDNNGNLIPVGNFGTSVSNWIRNSLSTRKIVGHNVSYDALVIKNNLGINLIPSIYSDTLLQKHTLAEEPPFALKVIAKEILGEWADKAEEQLKLNVIGNGGRYTKDHKDMFKADTHVLAEYCCWDVILTFKLFQVFEDRLKKENLYDLFYKEEIMPLYKNCTMQMKDKGFPVDIAYFEKLKQEIGVEITRLEDEIIAETAPKVADFCKDLLNEEFPVKNSGNFPKALAEVSGIPLPQTKDGKISLAKKNLDIVRKQYPAFDDYYAWVAGEMQVPPNPPPGKLWSKLFGDFSFNKAQEKLFKDKYPDRRHIFNLRSNEHLGHLFFTVLGYQPLETTETGKPKIDDEFLESIAPGNKDQFVSKLIDLKKLNKLLSTYVEGILERQINGIIFTSMLQFGTTSGRYSSRDPNLQNIPRIKEEDAGLSPLVLEYTNAIKRGFVAPSGYKIVNADYSSLEPICFAHVSNEEKLRSVFRNNEDLYSSVAINVFKVENCSANKKDVNYLKNLQPELRQQAKVFCLAVVYGAEAARINDLLHLGWKECDAIIREYLNTYPELKKYMRRCDVEAKTNGFVKTQFGRVRHLPGAKSIHLLYGDDIIDYKWASKKGLTTIRREYKNYLNNAKNFKIQGLAAHIVNRAMIATEKAFRDNNIDGYIAVQVHDEITCIVREDQAELASRLLKNCMENTTKISVPLKAEPLIADNWAEAK